MPPSHSQDRPVPPDPFEPLLPLDPFEPLLPLEPFEPLLPLDASDPLEPFDPLLPLDPFEPEAVSWTDAQIGLEVIVAFATESVENTTKHALIAIAVIFFIIYPIPFI